MIIFYIPNPTQYLNNYLNKKQISSLVVYWDKNCS